MSLVGMFAGKGEMMLTIKGEFLCLKAEEFSGYFTGDNGL
jgi:hypothetical protein